MRPALPTPANAFQRPLVWIGIACCSIVFALPTDSAHAQQRTGEERQGDRDDNQRGDDRGRWWRGGGESEDDRRARFMRSMDKNGDGKVERSEVDSSRMWESIQRRAKEGGLDTSKAISLDKYLTMRQKQERRTLGESVENPNAFGRAESTKAPGFDTPLTPEELAMLHPDQRRLSGMVFKADSAASTRSAISTRSSTSHGGSNRTEEYVRSLMKKYDKNNNKILERDEWKEMRGDPERSDLNHDGKITYDELIKRMRDRDGGRERSGDRRRENSSRDEGKSTGERRTYRFTSPLERLSDDARKWVEKYDDNGDGQVAMAEFSRTWTDSKVRDFDRHDLDGDGMVTGAEYLESK